MRKAIIDVGTNSIRLAVADCDGLVTMRETDIAITRIGEGMGKEQIIQVEPLARSCKVVADFAERARISGAEKILMTATSALREAANQKMAAQALEQAARLPLTILSGTQEAEMSYFGATMDLRESGAHLAVLDIGGGSTELVYESSAGLSKASVPIGAVRLQEDPALVPKIGEKLSQLLTKTLPRPLTLIGVGGTITSLAAMDQELEIYSHERVHGYRLSAATIEAWRKRLEKMSLSQREQLKGLMPKRADIMPWGVLILQEVMTLLEAKEIIVSDKDLLYGLLYEKM